MKQVARKMRAEGRVVGLVPTMGALHEGHLSLVRAAQQQCQPVVVSVFVNPKQFGPNEDFEKYPRPIEADRVLLEGLQVPYVFAPLAAEMYPNGFRTSVSVEGLGERLEGRSRPGHFRGVTTIVLKLFEIAQPHFAYFGRKDAQQVRLIRQMARDLNLDTEIVVCPIVRDADGLALSSRNAYLKGDQRRAAIWRGESGTRCGWRASCARRLKRSRWPRLTMSRSWTRRRLSQCRACDGLAWRYWRFLSGRLG